MTIPRFHVFTFRSPIRHPLSGLFVSNQLLPFSSVQINLLFPCNQYYQQSTSLWFLHRRPRSTIRPRPNVIMITPPPLNNGTVAAIDPLPPPPPNEISYTAYILVTTILLQCFPGLIFSLTSTTTSNKKRKKRDDDDDYYSTYNSLPRGLPTPKTRKDTCFIFERLGPKYTQWAYRMMEAAHFFCTLHRLLFPFKPNHLARPAGNN